ncbi:MAG: hypothetical protein K2X81_05705 [Candidatus Obscuribacterales bacterium]|nr:hypothetical protein [Candidatus Obscuribacterales bacterium]
MTVYQNTIENAAASAEQSLNVPATEFIEVIKKGAVGAYRSFSAENNSRVVKAEFDGNGHLRLFQKDNGEMVAVNEEVEIAIDQSVELLLDLLKEKTNEVSKEKARQEKEKAEELKRQLKERAEALIGKPRIAKIVGKDQNRRTIILELEDSILGEVSQHDALENDWVAEGTIPIMVASIIQETDKYVMSCSRTSKEIVRFLWQLEQPDVAIKAIARQAGAKSLIAVAMNNMPGEDKTALQQSAERLGKKLSSEKIELIEWDNKLDCFIGNCFDIFIHEIELSGNEAIVVISEDVEFTQDLDLVSALVGKQVRIKCPSYDLI